LNKVSKIFRCGCVSRFSINAICSIK